MLRTIVLSAALTMAAAAAQAATLYSENFDGQNGKGTDNFRPVDVTGVDWDIDASGVNFSSTRGQFIVGEDEFRARRLDGVGIWYSPTVDISDYENLELRIDFRQDGNLEIDDYADVYISLDNGVTSYKVVDINGFGVSVADAGPTGEPRSLVGDHNGVTATDFEATTMVEQIAGTGDSFRFWIEIANDGNSEMFAFDNISLAGTLVPPAPEPSPVPLPASGLLLLGGLTWTAVKRKRAI